MSSPSGRPGLRIVFEDTLQPFVEISCDAAVSYVLANQAGIARARGDLVAGARAARRERGAVRVGGDDARHAAVLVRRAYISISSRATLDAARARAARTALELRRG